MRVTIDGKEYVRADLSPSGDVLRLLAEVYATLWTEAFYDPYNDRTRKFAEPLARKMQEANKILNFKE